MFLNEGKLWKKLGFAKKLGINVNWK